jgi:hypothetical protein
MVPVVSIVFFQLPVGLPDAFWHCAIEVRLSGSSVVIYSLTAKEALIVRVDLAWVAGCGVASQALSSLLVSSSLNENDVRTEHPCFD